MQNIFEKTAIGILTILVLFLGLTIFNQQKLINQIKSQISMGNNTAVNSKISLPDNNEIESRKYFNGAIKAISIAGNSLDVEARLMEFKNPDKLKTDKAVNITKDDVSETLKLIRVSLNEKTEYSGLKKEDLKVGDKIFVTADNSPFKTDSLTALKIVYSAMKK